MNRTKTAKRRKRRMGASPYAHQSVASSYATNENQDINPSNPHWAK